MRPWASLEQDPGSRCPVPGAALTHPLPGLVLAVLRRHLAKALSGLQLLHGLHGAAVLLAQDVPNLEGRAAGLWRAGPAGGTSRQVPGRRTRTRPLPPLPALTLTALPPPFGPCALPSLLLPLSPPVNRTP